MYRSSRDVDQYIYNVCVCYNYDDNYTTGHQQFNKLMICMPTDYCVFFLWINCVIILAVQHRHVCYFTFEMLITPHISQSGRRLLSSI